MSECPACEMAATEVQMANVSLKSLREEMERLRVEYTEKLSHRDRVIDNMEERYRLLEDAYLDAKRGITQMKADREFSV